MTVVQIARELEVVEGLRQGVLTYTNATAFYLSDAGDRRQDIHLRETPFITYSVISGPLPVGNEGWILPTEYRNATGDGDPYATDVDRIYRSEAEILLSVHVFGDPDLAYNDPESASAVMEQLRHYLRGGICKLDLLTIRAKVQEVTPVRNLSGVFNTEEDALEHLNVDVTLRYAEVIVEQIESIERVDLKGHTKQVGESDDLYRETDQEVESDDFVEP